MDASLALNLVKAGGGGRGGIDGGLLKSGSGEAAALIGGMRRAAAAPTAAPLRALAGADCDVE